MRTVQLQPSHLGSGDGRSVRLHLGTWSLPARVAESVAGKLLLPPVVFEQWPLVPGQVLSLWKSPSGNDLHLGPVFGYVVERTERGDNQHRQSEWLEAQVAGADAAAVFVIFFSMLKLDRRRRLIRDAYTYSADGIRSIPVAPLPDVIYNRGTYPNLRKRAIAKRTRSYLRSALGIPFINFPAAFAKWETYRALQFFQETRGLMPPTVHWRDSRSLLRFINRHGQVFLKADGGTWGRDVLLIEAPAAGSRGYRLRGYLGSRRVDRTIRGRRLHRFLKARCRPGTWLLQRAIERQTLRDRVFDFRIVLQKDYYGVWQIPHVLVNWALPGEIVTNQRGRTEFLTAEEFREHWSARVGAFNAMVDEVKKLSQQVATVLESRYGMVGEMGLDIGVDQRGRPWLFEANTKPYFDPGEGAKYPFLYGKRLAGVNWQAKYSGRHPDLHLARKHPDPEFEPAGGG